LTYKQNTLLSAGHFPWRMQLYPNSTGAAMDQVDLLYRTLIKTTLLITDGDNRFFQRFNLGISRYNALVYIAANPGISLSELGKKLLCTKGNTTRLLKSLEADGLITRLTDTGDNRALCMYLTEKGIALEAEATAAYAQYNQERFACLAELQVGSLLQNLDALNAHLDSILNSIPPVIEPEFES
jgi:DNA-binding MarR family transcriptional regulator